MHRGRVQRWGDPYHVAKKGAPPNPALAHLTKSERIRRSSLLQRYGIDHEQYDAMLAAQDGVCAICSDPPQVKRLHVDHDHDTGKVRALLCTRCNTAMAVVDNEPLLASLLDYKQLHQAPALVGERTEATT